MTSPLPGRDRQGRDGPDGDAAARAITPTGGPTILRIMLGTQLRHLREGGGVTREDAADAIRGSHAKISRMELGRVKAKERDVADLLDLYGVTDPGERDALLTMTRNAGAPGWWGSYHDVLPDWFETYVGLEQAASVIRDYQAQFVPALLQTPDYTRSMLAANQYAGDDVDRILAVRARRQEILTRADHPPHVWTLLDEAALRRPYGRASVMRAQIDHLLSISELATVTIQVVPYRIGGHAGSCGPFTMLRFPQPDLSDVVYLEQLTSALYLDKRRDVEAYLTVMDRLSVQADDPTRTRRFLEMLR